MTIPTPCPSCADTERPRGILDARFCYRCDGALAADELAELREDRIALTARAEAAESRALAAEAALAEVKRERDHYSQVAHDNGKGRMIAEDERDAALEKVAALEGALRGVAHAHDGTDWCWCAYTRLVHPPDDPQDGVEVRDGHTEECWSARALLPGGSK